MSAPGPSQRPPRPLSPNSITAISSWLSLPTSPTASEEVRQLTTSPLSFLSTHAHFLPPHLLALFANVTTPEERGRIKEVRNRRTRWATQRPPPKELGLRECRERDPLLYSRLVGRKAPLEVSWTAAGAASSKSRGGVEGGGGSDAEYPGVLGRTGPSQLGSEEARVTASNGGNASGFHRLIQKMDEEELEAKRGRMLAEETPEPEYDTDTDTDTDEEMEEDEGNGPKSAEQKRFEAVMEAEDEELHEADEEREAIRTGGAGPGVEHATVEEEERDDLRNVDGEQDFLRTMTELFIAGTDPEMDYSVDFDERWDGAVASTLEGEGMGAIDDEEERWFEEEEAD